MKYTKDNLIFALRCVHPRYISLYEDGKIALPKVLDMTIIYMWTYPHSVEVSIGLEQMDIIRKARRNLDRNNEFNFEEECHDNLYKSKTK